MCRRDCYERGGWWAGFAPGVGLVVHFLPVDEEDVGPAVAVVVDDGDSAAGSFDDVTLVVDAAVELRTAMPA